MANVYTYIAPQGLIVTDAARILADVAAEYQTAFGTDLVVPDSVSLEGASTPQGLLIVTEALARIAAADNNAALANQINPNLAGGTALDAILALTGIQRTPATRSIVEATIGGVVGTSIPAGSQAEVESSGAVFETVQTVVIPTGGTLTGVIFQSVETGPIAAEANDLNTPISAVLGWETVQNLEPATLGATTQSDVAARQLRLNTLALQGASVAESIISGVIASGASSVYFLENSSSSTQVLPLGDVNGVSMVRNSIYACVNGGSNGTQSGVIVTITGTPGTIIPAGSQVSNGPIGLPGTLTSASTTVTMASTTGVVVGQSVSGVGIQSGTTVQSIVVDTSIVISNAALSSGAQNLVFASTGYVFSLDNNAPFSLPGTLTSASTTVTMASTTGVFVGQAVTGTGIPSSTTVTTVTTDTSIVISNAANSTGVQTLTFTSNDWVIPAAGSFDAPFSSVVYGAVIAAAASLTTIVTPVAGWSSATNPDAAVLGTTSTIAAALVSKKSAGAAYNNTAGASKGIPISALVTIPFSGQQQIVLYDNPAPVIITVIITVTIVIPVQDPVNTIKSAIVNYVNGALEGIDGLTVGQSVSSFEIAGAVTSQYPGIFVSSVLIAKSPTTPTSSIEIFIEPYQIASIAAGNISVVIQ